MAFGASGIVSLICTGLLVMAILALSVVMPVVLVRKGVGFSKPKVAWIMLQGIPDKTKIYE